MSSGFSPFVLGLLVQSAAAGDAELQRIEEEMNRLAQRNTWTGVERLYQELLALGDPVPGNIHLLGAEAARASGDALLLWRRLQRVPPASDDRPKSAAERESAQVEIASLEERFRFVSIQVAPDVLPVLISAEMPFAQLERDAISRAQSTLGEHHLYRGLLPVGAYVVGGQGLLVDAGKGWITMAVGYSP